MSEWRGYKVNQKHSQAMRSPALSSKRALICNLVKYANYLAAPKKYWFWVLAQYLLKESVLKCFFSVASLFMPDKKTIFKPEFRTARDIHQ